MIRCISDEQFGKVAKMVTSEVISTQDHSTLYLGSLKKDANITCTVSNYAGTIKSALVKLYAFNGEGEEC